MPTTNEILSMAAEITRCAILNHSACHPVPHELSVILFHEFQELPQSDIIICDRGYPVISCLFGVATREVYTGPKTGLDIDFGPCQEYDPVCNNCNHYNCGCPQSTACDGLYAEACQNQNNQGNVGAMTANNLTIHHQMVLRYWSYIYQSGNGGDPYIALCIFYPEICQIINNKLSDSNQPEGVRERLREINIELHNFGSRYGQGENRRILENCFGQLSEIEIEEVNGLLRSESSRLRDIFLYISETTGRLRASASNRNYGLNN